MAGEFPFGNFTVHIIMLVCFEANWIASGYRKLIYYYCYFIFIYFVCVCVCAYALVYYKICVMSVPSLLPSL